jgi:cell division transport system permease protein
MGKLRYFLREAARNLIRARAVNALTIGIISASLFILGGFLLLVSNLKAAVEDWNQVAVIAYLADETSQAELDDLMASSSARSFVEEVRYISREEAASLFKDRFAHLSDAADALGGNPFPASIEILASGKRDERLSETDVLISSLRSMPIVEEVRDNEEDAKKVLALINVISVGGWVVGGILATASLFTIFNVIRLTVYQRRDEISIMRLVGATGTFIRAPFLLEGTLQGTIGAITALALLFVGYGQLHGYAVSSANPFLQLLTAGFLNLGQAASLAAAGTLLGATGSLLSLRRFLAD